MSNIFKSPKRTAGNKWLETINPINALSITEARSIYDAARRYGSPRLQKIYDEIELTDPVLMTCVERRQSALAGLGWKVKARASADETLADEQRNAVDAFLAKIDNFTDALCHLDLAYFRGFSHTQPIWEGEVKAKARGEGEVKVSHINLLNNWNFLTGEDGEWLWNPCCSIDPRECYPITPAARMMSIVRRRAIDYPALAIYIRKALGERDWGRFIERYGIPPVDVVMAPNTTEEQRDDYLESAERARDGLPTAWPAGSVTTRAEGSRGQDPFTAFIEHQEKLIVLAATGGTLTSLAQSDTGSLAGGAQMDVWREIVLRDALVIADVVERALVRPFVEAAFPGQPLAVAFELGVERKPTAIEAAQLAGAIRSAGYIVDQAELEQATGFKLEREEAKVEGEGEQWNASAFARAKSKEAKVEGEEESKVEGEGEQRNILAAFAADNKPLADAIEELFKDLEEAEKEGQGDRGKVKGKGERSRKELVDAFLEKLPTLMPDDPAMAAVIAEEMARAFGGGEEDRGKRVEDRGKRVEGRGSGEEITQEMAEKIYEEMMSK